MKKDKEKSFVVVRIKTNGVSIHRVYVDSKRQASSLVWEDDAKLIGKIITTGEVSLSPFV